MPQIPDPVRRRRVALTPEEEVRQAVIATLHSRYGYPLELMQVEGQIALNGMARRCDIVVYAPGLRPAMIVECKRPQVTLTQRVADQACRYNLALGVPYLLLTNGRQTLCLATDPVAATLTPLAALPSWDELVAQMLKNEPPRPTSPS
ncbi:MAG: type I restriction enzyme HsdR N-terminal domain-containing protein [Bacteroidales bacterium]|nr:type I restriction enzyme HsdR N-terminal domain-containing protein [Bacteroidales bacterium]